MAKIARNAPCPCGSGKKYKKCCLSLQRAPNAELAAFVNDSQRLDELSNGVVDLIRAGSLDEAEALCRKLALEYPDEIDPIERAAMISEARGDNVNAAESYRKAAEYARTHEGFDPNLIEEFLASARRLESS